MATTKQQEAFAKELGRMLDLTVDLDDDAASDVLMVLRQARTRVAAAILDAEGFDLFHLTRIQRAINITFQNFARDMDFIVDAESIAAFDLGIATIDSPLSAAGAAIQVSALPQVSTQVINAQTLRNTQFITNLSTEAANRINGEILLGITGEQSPQQVMKRIGNALTDKSTFGTIASRAEAITRTEINAALNAGTVARLDQASRQINGLRKFWVDTRFGTNPREEHIRQGNKTNPGFGGKPIPVSKDFNLQGEKARGPHDPRLSAKNSVNCRCRLGMTISEETNVSEIGRVFV